MSQSASHLKLKFLLHENVKRKLHTFLKAEGYDVIACPKGVSNGKLATLSKSEKRILVTNDSDFSDPVLYPKENIYSVIWLRVPQENSDALIKSFSVLLNKTSKSEDFEGHLIILKEKDFEISTISSE